MFQDFHLEILTKCNYFILNTQYFYFKFFTSTTIGETVIRIIATNGKTMSQSIVNGIGTLSIDFDVPAGTYFVQITSTLTSEVLTVVKR